MSKLPSDVKEAWKNHKGPVVFTTVSDEGVANSIYVTCISLYDDEMIVIADNYFDKTRENIINGSNKGGVLFISEDDIAFQIKGTIEYLKEGTIFDDMKKWNPDKHPGHAATVLKVEEVYSGAKKLVPSK